MPTVIDSLIVELGLDPRKYTEGQKKALDSLRDFENKADRSIKQVTSASGNNMVSFFHAMESPFASLRQHFERLSIATIKPHQNLSNLGVQARRTGSDVQSGALAGAAGLRILGGAGVAAFVAIKALDTLMQQADRSANKVFGAGFGASATGMPINAMSGLSRTLFKGGAVPEQETQSFLSGIARSQEQARRAGWDQSTLDAIQHSQAGTRGPRIDPTRDSGAVWMQKWAIQFGMLSEREAIAAGAFVNMTDKMVIALRNQGAAFSDNAKREQAAAITENQLSGSKELLESHRRLAAAEDNLTRMMNEYLNPAFAKFYNWLAFFYESLAEKDMSKINKATAGIQVLPGGSADLDAATGNALAVWWSKQSWVPAWAKPKPASVGPRAGNDSLDPQTAAALEVINRYESPGGNVRNGRYDAGHTASGYSQVTDTNWKSYGPRVGVDISKFPTAISASKAMQAAVAGLMFREQGFTPWDTAHGGAMTPARIAEARAAMAAAGVIPTSGAAVPGGPSPASGLNPALTDRLAAMVAAMPPDIRRVFSVSSGYRDAARQQLVNPGVRNSRHMLGMAADIDPRAVAWVKAHPEYGFGFPLSGAKEYNHMEPMENGQRIANPREWTANRALIRGQQNPAVSHRVNDFDINGPITVNTAATDAPGVAYALGGALKAEFARTSRVTSAAKGLDG